MWLFYSDSKTHRLDGVFKLPTGEKRVLVRWLLFLHSDFEYKWPDFYLPGYDPATRLPKTWWQKRFSVFFVSPAKAEKFLSAGHYPVWPFISVVDYKAALRNPRLLSGRASHSA